MSEQVVYDTPWFQLVARTPTGWTRPHYSIRTSDYVCVVAHTHDGGLLLVRQYRPAVDGFVLDLPSGHVDPGENPEVAAARELEEETGYRAGRVELLGCLRPDVGRLGNRMWCFRASDLTRVEQSGSEEGVECVTEHRPISELIREPEFNHALHHAALFLAASQGQLDPHSRA